MSLRHKYLVWGIWLLSLGASRSSWGRKLPLIKYSITHKVFISGNVGTSFAEIHLPKEKIEQWLTKNNEPLLNLNKNVILSQFVFNNHPWRTKSSSFQSQLLTKNRVKLSMKNTLNFSQQTFKVVPFYLVDPITAQLNHTAIQQNKLQLSHHFTVKVKNNFFTCEHLKITALNKNKVLINEALWSVQILPNSNYLKQLVADGTDCDYQFTYLISPAKNKIDPVDEEEVKNQKSINQISTYLPKSFNLNQHDFFTQFRLGALVQFSNSALPQPFQIQAAAGINYKISSKWIWNMFEVQIRDLPNSDWRLTSQIHWLSNPFFYEMTDNWYHFELGLGFLTTQHSKSVIPIAQISLVSHQDEQQLRFNAQCWSFYDSTCGIGLYYAY